MYPNKEQTTSLLEIRGLHCWVYNTLIEEHKRRYNEGLPSYSFNLMCKDITRWRSNTPSLESLNAQSLQVTAKRVSLAFQAFYRRIKTGENPGYPRFKSLGRYPGWGYKSHGDGWRLFVGEGRKHSLRIHGIGELRLRGKGRFAGVPKTCEVIYKQGKWYISVTFEVDSAQIARAKGKDTAAFDWGLTKLLTIAKADGGIETFENPRRLRSGLATLKKLQQTVLLERFKAKAKAKVEVPANQQISDGTRPKIPSKLKRLYKQIAARQSKVSRQRHDFYHKLSAILVQRFGFLATRELVAKEKFNRFKPKQEGTSRHPADGANRKLIIYQNIHNAAPAMLMNMIRVKAEEAGSWLSLANPEIVQQIQRCHKCGTLVMKGLNESWHTCLKCKVHCGRDENTVKTILRWFLEGYFWLGTSPAARCQPETSPLAA